jgi:hypothetical protein
MYFAAMRVPANCHFERSEKSLLRFVRRLLHGFTGGIFLSGVHGRGKDQAEKKKESN